MNPMPVGQILTHGTRSYQILECIGRGANAAVYLAQCCTDTLTTRCILKEYCPRDETQAAFRTGKARFLEAAARQNQIRQRMALCNQTPPVTHWFEANHTAFVEVACYYGTPLDRLTQLPLPQIIRLCATISKTVNAYHEAGYLCLDLKPSNLFILQDSEQAVISQLVEFIDFDSVQEAALELPALSYTREWAAPEQIAGTSGRQVTQAADIYTLGELVFWFLFGRHSQVQEHRGFSQYPFASCKVPYRHYLSRPEVERLFTQLFRNTLRSSAHNRFTSAAQVARLLEQLAEELERKTYILPLMPPMPPHFVGRQAELAQIQKSLEKNRILFLSGVGGIGKSTLVRHYMGRHKADYDALLYLEYHEDLLHTLADDTALQISTIARQDSESLETYVARKLKALQAICYDKRVLLVLDNYTDPVTKALSRLLSFGYDTIVVTRRTLPQNSYPVLPLNAISEPDALLELFALNLERPILPEEQPCLQEIITLIQGHTLVLELIARQIAAGKLQLSRALALIRKSGFSRFSPQRIGNLKDGEEVYATLFQILSALFQETALSEACKASLKALALLDVRGLEKTLVFQSFQLEENVLEALATDGWITAVNGRIRVHPVIAEAALGWQWGCIPERKVLALHESAAEIYTSMGAPLQLERILQSAKAYIEAHPSHYNRAVYCDLQGTYYDTALDGAYVVETPEEAALLVHLIHSMREAIRLMETSTQKGKAHALIRYRLSLANVLLRSNPAAEAKETAKLLNRTEKLLRRMPEEQEALCYFSLCKAWYYTLAKPDPYKTAALLEQAQTISQQVFSEDLVRIDVFWIPAANCWFYHAMLDKADAALTEAVQLCEAHPDSASYRNKKAELLCCLLDVRYEAGDKRGCQTLIAKLDQMREKYGEQEIRCQVKPEIREAMLP